jgi:alpha-galactosidase
MEGQVRAERANYQLFLTELCAALDLPTPDPADPTSHRFKIEDLAREDIRARLRAVWLDPASLDPSKHAAAVTREVAAHLAELAKSFEAAGHEPQVVADFLARCLFCMFAEDVGLLAWLIRNRGRRIREAFGRSIGPNVVRLFVVGQARAMTTRTMTRALAEIPGPYAGESSAAGAILKTLALLCSVSFASLTLAAEVRLDELNLSLIQQGWAPRHVVKVVRGAPLKMAGQTFAHGVGTHAVSRMYVRLDGGSTRFRAVVGIDDANPKTWRGSVQFRVYGDDKLLFKSAVKHNGDAGEVVDVDVTGVELLMLLADDGGVDFFYDRVDWAEARFDVTGANPQLVAAPMEAAVILTPKPGPAPRINGPKVYGCRPGNPFLFRIPCTGERPMQFIAKDLPATLTLDPLTGIMAGTAPARGEYRVTLQAANRHGKSERVFKIVAGDKIALTPTMGFSNWYGYFTRATEADFRYAADKMISSGMADVGYDYLEVDDCWAGGRDKDGNITGNSKFPDMKALADYLHGKGFKAGIYTSPGAKTCAGSIGSLGHEEQDAKRFADWGYDLLKYDWCFTYAPISRVTPQQWIVPGMNVEGYQKPYRQMGDLLKRQKRDIVFNLCQYGMGDVWNWGAEVGGNSWRIGEDLGAELHRLFDVALKTARLREHNKPGEWNDPDYIQIGWIGSAWTQGPSQPAPMSPSEQYAFMSLWCLMASPLLYSGDMTKLDEFTLNILCNPEVIEINQDPLGQCARVVTLDEDSFVMIKELEDGSKALGLCNKGYVPLKLTARWSDIGVAGRQTVRDLWRQKDIGEFDGEFTAAVPRRGVTLVGISRPEQKQAR